MMHPLNPLDLTRKELATEIQRLADRVSTLEDTIAHLHRTLDKAIAALCAWNGIELPKRENP